MKYKKMCECTCEEDAAFNAAQQVLPMPKALYSCSEACCEGRAYYPDELDWYREGQRWVCDYCWGDLPKINGDGEMPVPGINMEAYLGAVDTNSSERAAAADSIRVSTPIRPRRHKKAEERQDLAGDQSGGVPCG